MNQFERFIESLTLYQLPDFPHVLKPVLRTTTCAMEIARAFDIDNATITDAVNEKMPLVFSNTLFQGSQFVVVDGTKLCKVHAQEAHDKVGVVVEFFDAYNFDYIETKCYNTDLDAGSEAYVLAVSLITYERFLWVVLSQHRENLKFLRIDTVTGNLMFDDNPDNMVIINKFETFYNLRCSNLDKFDPLTKPLKDSPHIRIMKTRSIINDSLRENHIAMIKLFEREGFDLNEYIPGTCNIYGDLSVISIILMDLIANRDARVIALVSPDKKMRILKFDKASELINARVLRRGDGAILLIAPTHQRICIIKEVL